MKRNCDLEKLSFNEIQKLTDSLQIINDFCLRNDVLSPDEFGGISELYNWFVDEYIDRIRKEIKKEG